MKERKKESFFCVVEMLRQFRLFDLQVFWQGIMVTLT